MLIKKLFRKFKRFFDFLIGDKSNEIYWRYKSFFSSDWRDGYLDSENEIHPHRELLLEKISQKNSIESISKKIDLNLKNTKKIFYILKKNKLISIQ